VLKQVELTLGDRRVSLRVDDETPPVSVDPLRLDQVLTNVLENAAKYSTEGAPIELRVSASSGGAEVAVTDHGPGIDPEDMPRLFDRYYQTQRAREKKSGLGLGLYITKGLVEAHGGRMWVESTRGVGSTFYLWLPKMDPAEAETGVPVG
jgi:signal transduction histidine kinase